MKQTSYKDPGWENVALDTQQRWAPLQWKFHNDYTEQTTKWNKVPQKGKNKDFDFWLTLKSHDPSDST